MKNVFSLKLCNFLRNPTNIWKAVIGSRKEPDKEFESSSDADVN